MNDSVLAVIVKEPWAIDSKFLDSLYSQLSLASKAGTASIEAIGKLQIQTKQPMQIIGDSAVIKISGVLMKSVPSIFRWMGVEATEYSQIIEQLSEAAGNSSIKSITLHIDSPGGTVAGVSETAEKIAAVNKIKPVNAYIEDLGASGAYYLASQAGTITANPNAEIGSIGVYCVAADYSRAAENIGIKVHVIRSGEHKGMGVVGAAITEEQVKAVKDIVDGMAENFINAVVSGRKMSKENAVKLATGQLWLADKAKSIGLIDNITNGFLTGKNQNKSNMKGKFMPDETKENQVDSAKIAQEAKNAEMKRSQDLQAAFPNDPKFAMEQFAAGATVTEAKAKYADVLAAKNADLAKENEELKNKKNNSDEADAVATAGQGGNSTADFIALSKERAKERKIGMTEAMRQIKAENPAIYEQHVEDCRKKPVKVSGSAKRI